MVFAIHWHESAMDLHLFPILIPLPTSLPSHPSGSSQCTSPEHLSHASNLGWSSASPLIVYLFQFYSLRTSHPRLLPQSPKVCSVHVCLFFCPAYRVIVTIFLNSIYMCSVPFSCYIVSDSLRPHELQYTRPPCPSLTPRVYPNSYLLSRWCHPVISSSVISFSSCPQSLPALGSFPMNQLFTWGGQSIGVSASASVLPMYTQG